jgi:two-component system, cell cycle sensor histidine kinase and response regulator CckA
MAVFRKSLKFKLIFLVILGLIPLVLLTLFNNLELREEAIVRAQKKVLATAGHFEKQFNFVVEETRQVLKVLAQEPNIMELGPNSCLGLFNPSVFKKTFPFYIDLGVIDSSGKLVCSVLSDSGMKDFTAQSYFNETSTSMRFSIGLFHNSSVSGSAEVGFGYPILDSEGKFKGVVFAIVDMRILDTLFQHHIIPPNASLTVIDSMGFVMARYPDTSQWIGISGSLSEIVKKILDQHEGAIEAVGIDGVRKIYGFRRLGSFSKGPYVYVGIPVEHVTEGADRLLLSSLFWLGVAALLGMALVSGLSYLTVIRHLNTLINSTEKIKKGDLSARTGLDGRNGEIGLLGSAFDQMAASLHERENERKVSHEELQKEKHLSDALIDSLPGVFYLFDKHGRLLRWNRNAEKVTGYSNSEIAKLKPLDLIAHADRKKVRESFEKSLNNVDTTIEALYLTKTGETIPYFFTGRAIEIDNARCVIGTGLDISERQRIEKELKDKEHLLKTILATSPVGIHLAESRTIKWANEAWIKMFGFKNEADFIEKSARIIYESEEEFERVGNVLYSNLGKGNVGEVDSKLKRQDGTNFDATIRIARLTEFDSQNDTIVAVVTDVSQRVKNEEALRESEQRYRNLIETMTEAIGIVDREGVLTYANKRACQMLGCAESDLIGHKVDKFLDESSRETLAIQMTKRNVRLSESYELTWVKMNGEILHTLVSSRSIFDSEGVFKGSLATATDITDRKLYERRLADSEKKMRSLIEQAPIGIAIFQDGKYFYANPELMAMFKCEDSAEIEGRSLTEFVAPGHQYLFMERYRRFLAGKPTRQSYQVEGIKKSGELFEMVIWPKTVEYDNHLAVLAFFMDVSENRNLRAQLIQAQKMEAIGTLAGGIAHDFNNLLQVIIGYSELILMDSNLTDKLRQSVKSVNKAAVNGADLVKRILTFSRKTETRPKPLDLNHEIKQIKKLLDRTIFKMIEIELHLSDEIDPISGDAAQIEQIIMNLAVNAKDAMPEGGRLIIETSGTILGSEYCASHIEATPGPSVCLSVSDTGSGMDRITIERIFEPFFTTKASGKGTGLGLAMVYGIVKQHGGHVTCYSEMGNGTTFKIYFPALVSEKISPDKTDIKMTVIGNETILLVDDEETVREVGKELLEDFGYRVITAMGGREALSIYEAERDNIDLVILDLMMPEMGGKECLEELLKINPSLKSLICSGYSANGAAKAAISIGASGFVGKPYIFNELLSEIRKILDESRSGA